MSIGVYLCISEINRYAGMQIVSSSLLDVWIRVTRRDCDVTNTITGIDPSGGNIRMLRTSPGRTMSSHMIRIYNGDPEELRAMLIRKGVKIVRILGNNTLWVRSRSCSACSLLSREDCVVIEGIPVSSTEISYRLLVPGLGALRDIIRSLADAGLQPVVVRRAEHTEPGELTPRQLEVLLFAYKKGYFDTPRKTSLAEMARIMGIRTTSLRDIVRRALKKIVRKYLTDMGILQE
ncbi:MAG: hypothetical protein DJ555_01150 [Desulfurococcaceae archaeon]|nr:MAG: hypothetical protein DJ555_01150 [Desulfurococcaceae archaeon]